MLIFRKRRLLIGYLGLSGSIALAESGSSLEFKHEFFWDRNGVWNQTPAFSLQLALSRKWKFGWEQELDVVSGASRRIGANLTGLSGDRDVDAVSGASKVEIRHSENPSLTYSHGGLSAGGSYYTSRESDYFSQSPAGFLACDFNDRNTTFGVNFAEFFDDFAPRGAFQGMGGKKRIHSLGATVAQSLTTLTLAGLTATWIRSDGYLAHPYNPPMDVNGLLINEIVPGRKQAGALSGQFIQGFNLGGKLGSVNLDARRYLDNWGLKSATLDAKVSQYVAEGTYVRLRLRYYNQTGTAFAKPTYTGQESYRTADIRFYPFVSWLGGLKISSGFPESWGEMAFLPDRWDLKYDQTFRNTPGDPSSFPSGMPRHTTYQLYEPDEFYQQGVFMFGMVFNL